MTFLKEIGDYLHRVREEKNISLKEIQEATKISMRYLEAIDRGDLDGIPGEVYRKGFLVNFANAIGLDGQEILQKYYQMKNAAVVEEQQQQLLQQQKQLQQQPQRQQRQQHQPIQTPVVTREKKVTPSDVPDDEQLKGLYLGIVVALIGILIVASFFLFPYYRNNHLDDTDNTKIETSTDTNKVQTNPIAPITVNVIFKEKVWVQVKSDGDYLYGADGMSFDASQSQQVWTAQREMIIKMGNPAGIMISLNGKDLGQLGERGKIKTIRLTPKGVEAL
ncbi:MAG TPA: hypothetical protein DDW50_05080 [Firmicutes bacterium]|nr:hypothetical protein [Bacillota bacterium]